MHLLPGAVLAIALEQAHRRAMRHALAVGTARLSERVAGELSAALAGADSRRRADAQELLLNLVPPRCGQALGPLLEAPAKDAPLALETDNLAEYLTHRIPGCALVRSTPLDIAPPGSRRRGSPRCDAHTPAAGRAGGRDASAARRYRRVGPIDARADGSPAGDAGREPPAAATAAGRSVRHDGSIALFAPGAALPRPDPRSAPRPQSLAPAAGIPGGRADRRGGRRGPRAIRRAGGTASASSVAGGASAWC